MTDSQDNVYVSGGLSQCSNNNGSNPYYSIPRIGDNNGVDYTSTNTGDSCLRTFLAKFSNIGVFQWIHYPYAPVANTTPIPITLRNFYMVNDVIYWLLQIPPGTYENGAFSNTNTNEPFTYYVLTYDTNGTFLTATPFDLQLSGYTSYELRWYRNPYNGYYYAVYQNNPNNAITATAGGTTLNAGLPKIICFNAQGQYQWYRESTGNNMSLNSIDFDPQNNVYVIGSTSSTSNTNFLGWTAYGSGSGATSFVMKCNPTVTSYDWVTNYTTSSIAGASQRGQPQVHYNTYTNEVLFGGLVGWDFFYWGTQTQSGPGGNNGSDALLARFNPANGECLGMHRLVGGNGYNDGFTKIVQDNNGDLILGGYMGYQLTDSNGTNYYSYGGNSDFMVTKFATQACTPLASERFELQRTKIYPNPVQNVLTVAVSEHVTYVLYDVLGKQLLKGSLTPTENTIAMSGFEKGVYLLQLNRLGVMEKVKVVKE